MKYKLHKLFGICAFVFLGNCCSSFADESQSFIVLSQPKGGTCLLIKLLEMMTNKKKGLLYAQFDSNHVPSSVEEAIKNGWIPTFHVFAPEFTLHYFLSFHFQTKVILIVRDPRDGCVSYAHWISIDPSESIQFKLDRALNDLAYGEMIRGLPLFLNHPRFFLVRFEDLVGPEGGGSIERQKKAISSIAEYIGMKFSEEKIDEFAANLFGNKEKTPVSLTFREGKIGSWRQNFSEENIKVFKSLFNDVLLRLGYVDDSDW